MRKYLTLLFLLISINSWAAAPQSSFTYISGQTIIASQVQTNENNIYSYLQSGVDTYKAGSISESSISSTAGILYSQLNLSGGILPSDINNTITTSIYTFQNITVPGTFNLGVTHTGDLLIDSGTSFVRYPDSATVGQALISQGETTAPIYGFPSGQLGAWTTKSVTTVYQATTDGFAVAWIQVGSSNAGISLLTDSNSIPSTTRSAGGTPINASNSGGAASIFSPVKKNDYYEVTDSGSISAINIYFISLGS